MTAEERERMMWLCKRIQEEKDPRKFSELLLQLDELLAAKKERIREAKGTRSTAPPSAD